MINKNRIKKIIILIIVLFFLMLLVSGGSFAYWTWVTAASERTNVSLTIEAPNMSATLTGHTQNITNLIPVSSCTDETYVIKKELTLTYDNLSTNAGEILGTLSVENFVNPYGIPDSDDLSHLHYAVTTSPDSCTIEPLEGMNGTFKSTSGNLFSKQKLVGPIPSGTTGVEKKFYLWVWLDSEYTHQNVGSGIANDPMQDISFTLTWSGEISNETNYSGYYIYNMVSERAVLDNVPSLYVKNLNGIDFFETSSNENGKGVYILSETMNDDFPVYYYRGAVLNNNVIFGGFCWKILRTTETGGTKLIYNGVPVNGQCNNVGTSALSHIGIVYGDGNDGLSSGGYSFTEKSRLDMSSKSSNSVTPGTIFSSDIEYVEVTDPSTGTKTWKYRLIGDKVTSSSNFNLEREVLLQNHHYSCFSTTSDECNEVLYFYMVRDNNNYYASLKNGLLLKDLLDIEFNGNSTNTIKSNIHITVENWYAESLNKFSDYIEDTVYCNDRSLYRPWSNTSSVANTNDAKTHFGSKARVAYTGDVSVDCPYIADSFTVNENNGNGILEYPVGLITFDEAALAGFAWGKESIDNYLTNVTNVWWSMSPGFISATGVYIGVIYSTLDHVAVNYTGTSNAAGGVRPVISLKYGIEIARGKGTVYEPFIIE